jgi:hypothetical protein
MSELFGAIGDAIVAYFYPMDLAERLLVFMFASMAVFAAGAAINYAIRANERKRMFNEMRRHMRNHRATMKATASHKG